MKRFKRLASKWLKKMLRISKAISIAKIVIRDGDYVKANISYVESSSRLEGKRVLITGGGSGIGLSIAKKLLSEGASVVVTGRNERKLKKVCNEINNPSFSYLVWDISDLRDIGLKVETACTMLNGSIDILINNAGILSSSTFENIQVDEWDRVYAINSKGVFFLTQYMCNRWVDEKPGLIKKIINISSQGGFVGATYPYRMTKWDINGLTQGLGIKYASKGIIVNGIAPGIILTGMQPNYIKQDNNLFSHQNPINRIGFPEEIAELAAFLASDTANFIVGQTIVCDGGYVLK